MQKIIVPFLISFIISLLFTPVAIKLAPVLGFMDIPKDNRRMHKKPMPLAGGTAIYLGVIICLLIFLRDKKDLFYLIASSSLILISGLIDDKVGLSPKMKILFQISAAIILVLGGSRIEFFTNFLKGSFLSHMENVIWLEYLSVPFTIFWIVGITNTVNLIDGLDGLAAGVSGICALSLMFIALKMDLITVALLSAIVAGGALGFLPYNFNPAKIFMGDTGALFLGFMLSYISVQGVMKYATALTIFVPVLVLGVPVFDTTFAMIRRFLSGKKISEADKGHLHHRLLALGLSQRQTVLILYTISIIFGVLANVISDFDPIIGIISSVIIILFIFVLAYAKGMFKNKEEK